MPVVSSVWNAVTQANGGKSVTERHFDQDGAEVALKTWFAQSGTDIQAIVDARAIEISAQLADNEFEAVVGGN